MKVLKHYIFLFILLSLITTQIQCGGGCGTETGNPKAECSDIDSAPTSGDTESCNDDDEDTENDCDDEDDDMEETAELIVEMIFDKR